MGVPFQIHAVFIVILDKMLANLVNVMEFFLLCGVAAVIEATAAIGRKLPELGQGGVELLLLGLGHDFKLGQLRTWGLRCGVPCHLWFREDGWDAGRQLVSGYQLEIMVAAVDPSIAMEAGGFVCVRAAALPYSPRRSRLSVLPSSKSCQTPSQSS